MWRKHLGDDSIKKTRRECPGKDFLEKAKKDRCAETPQASAQPKKKTERRECCTKKESNQNKEKEDGEKKIRRNQGTGTRKRKEPIERCSNRQPFQHGRRDTLEYGGREIHLGPRSKFRKKNLPRDRKGGKKRHLEEAGDGEKNFGRRPGEDPEQMKKGKGHLTLPLKKLYPGGPKAGAKSNGKSCETGCLISSHVNHEKRGGMVGNWCTTARPRERERRGPPRPIRIRTP